MADENNDVDTIRAAGGLVWRDSPHGREVAVIYRARYGDWTLPKGKLNPGEDWRDAAIREVKEETGYDVQLKSLAGKVSYKVEGRPKVVQFWNMVPIGESEFKPSEEVKKVVWLPVQEALEKLDYDGERDLLRNNSNDVKNGTGVSRLKKLIYHYFYLNLWGKSVDKARLVGDIDYYRKRLEYLKHKSRESDSLWAQITEDLLDNAQKALDDHNKDLSWRSLDAARSFSLFGLGNQDLRAEAQAIRNEAEDPSKKVNAWRRKTIQDYLCEEGKLKLDLQGRDLFNASTILYENHHNKYYKMWKLKRELLVLALVAAITVIPCLILVPILIDPNIKVDYRVLVSSVVLFGIMGASISGILSVARGGADARITEQLIGFWVLLAKLVVGAASALVIFTFILSGFLSLNTTPAQVMAVSFAAGFSERLVTLAVESVTKK